MIVKPKIRGFICTTAHPLGCARHVQEQIDYVRGQAELRNGPKRVLVIGASTGYGLASRIVAGFGAHAGSIGVSFEKEAEKKRTATAGWYNTRAYEQAAQADGLYARSFNGDAFSDEIKDQVVEAIKRDLGDVDLVVYSLASPRRIHPKTGEVAKSVLKPISASYTNKSIDFDKNEIISVTLPPATDEEIAQTMSVMGGEDWEMWIDALEQRECLADGIVSVAYSYVGPEITNVVYRKGTIGAAKDHLEATAKKLHFRLESLNGRAYVSVNKALVTQSSSAIPFIPLYFVILMKVMKKKGVHEDCIEQIYRMFSAHLYSENAIAVDDKGRIRIDDFEMRPDIQQEVMGLWDQISNENLNELADIKGYQSDFLKLFGFGMEGVDYDADIEIS